MISPPAQDPSTAAQIFVEDRQYGGDSAERSLFTRIVDTVTFSYSSDVLQLGDPFSVAIPDSRGEYTRHFTRGSKILLYLKNPGVNGGAPTRKHTGIIVRRRVTCSNGQGTVIQLECADLGWHLQNNDARLHYRLQYGTLEKLLTDPKFIDPSWGIAGIATDNEIGRLIRRGKNNGRAAANLLAAPSPFQPLHLIQVEPGDRVADILHQYARRINVLVNVSADGFIQLFRPNHDQEARHRIEFHGLGERVPNPNNVIESRMEESIESIWTRVTCVGEVVGTVIAGNTGLDQNYTKRWGAFVDPDVLPFFHRKVFAEGDIFNSAAARAQAKWQYERGIYDSWSIVYTVRGHHQNGEWWESDTMCEVNDTVNGIKGLFYVPSVTCIRDQNGDRTEVTLRKPGLLQASYGLFSRAPRLNMSPPATASSTSTETSTSATTTVTRS